MTASGVSASTTKNLPVTKATTKSSRPLNHLVISSVVGCSLLNLSQLPSSLGGTLLWRCSGTTLKPDSAYASAKSNAESSAVALTLNTCINLQN